MKEGHQTTPDPDKIALTGNWDGLIIENSAMGKLEWKFPAHLANVFAVMGEAERQWALTAFLRIAAKMFVALVHSLGHKQRVNEFDKLLTKFVKKFKIPMPPSVH